MKCIILFCCCFVLHVCAQTSDEYRQQCARNPDDYSALYNAGVAAFKENNLERAQESFNFLKEVDAQTPWNAQQGEQIFYNAGNTEMKLKAYKDAVASFEKVLTYNPSNEVARKKLELAKKLLEEQQKQDQQQDKQDQNKDKQDKKDDKKDQKDKNKDQNQDKNKDQQDQNQKNDQKNDNQDEPQENSPDQKHNQKQDQQQHKDKDKHEQQQQEKNKEQQKEQSKDTQKKDEQSQAQDAQQGEKDKKPEPELTQHEQRILAYAQNMDEKMHEALQEKTLKKAQGVIHDHHNW